MLILIISCIQKRKENNNRLTFSSMICQSNLDNTKIDTGKTKIYPLSGKIIWELKGYDCSSLVARIGCWSSFEVAIYSFTPFGLCWIKEQIWDPRANDFLEG